MSLHQFAWEQFQINVLDQQQRVNEAFLKKETLSSVLRKSRLKLKNRFKLRHFRWVISIQKRL